MIKISWVPTASNQTLTRPSSSRYLKPFYILTDFAPFSLDQDTLIEPSSALMSGVYFNCFNLNFKKQISYLRHSCFFQHKKVKAKHPKLSTFLVTWNLDTCRLVDLIFVIILLSTGIVCYMAYVRERSIDHFLLRLWNSLPPPKLSTRAILLLLNLNWKHIYSSSIFIGDLLFAIQPGDSFLALVI